MTADSTLVHSGSPPGLDVDALAAFLGDAARADPPPLDAVLIAGGRSNLTYERPGCGRQRADRPPAAARPRARDRARHGPRVPGHRRAGGHRRPCPAPAPAVHRSAGHRRAVLRNGQGRRRRLAATGPRSAARRRARRRDLPAHDRHAGDAARDRPGAGRAWRTSADRRGTSPSGQPLAAPARPVAQPRSARTRRAVPAAGRCGPGRVQDGDRARRLPAGQPADRRQRPDHRGPRLGDVDDGRPAGRHRGAGRLRAGGDPEPVRQPGQRGPGGWIPVARRACRE